MSKPEVSIVLPCFNGEKFIEKQILSILNQTYRSIELIIVDDRSTDNTVSIVSELAKNFSQIKLHINSKNLGLNKNFEKAISLAGCNFIALSDQDDIWTPTKIDELLNAIGDHWLIFSNSELINDKDEKLGSVLLENFSLERRSFKSISINNFVTGHTVLFKRELLKYALPLPSKGFYDWWLGFVAIYHQRIAFLDKNLTLYRVHEQSVIQQQAKKVYAKELAQAELHYNTTLTNLYNVQNYSFLKDQDKGFLKTFSIVYELRKTSLIPLVVFYYIYFNDLFPSHRKKKRISKSRWKLAKQLAKI